MYTIGGLIAQNLRFRFDRTRQYLGTQAFYVKPFEIDMDAIRLFPHLQNEPPIPAMSISARQLEKISAANKKHSVSCA